MGLTSFLPSLSTATDRAPLTPILKPFTTPPYCVLFGQRAASKLIIMNRMGQLRPIRAMALKRPLTAATARADS